MIDQRARLRLTGLLAAGLALTAALWPSRPQGAQAVTAAPAVTGVSVMDGAVVFRLKGCATCHDGPTSAARFAVAPNLADLAGRAGNRVEGQDAPEYVRQSVRQPRVFVVPGYETAFPVMPALPVSDQELDALVRYLLG